MKNEDVVDALETIAAGFYNLANAIKIETLEPEPVDTPNPTRRAKPKKDRNELLALLNKVSTAGKRDEAMGALDDRKLAALSDDEIQEVYAKVEALL